MRTRPGPPEVFWGELAPGEHVAQIYEQSELFLDCLEGFVSVGLRAGEGVIVIATPPHRRALEERLAAQGIDVDFARSLDHYIDLDAEATLSKFMINGWPDDALFRKSVDGLLSRARVRGGRVRAFGEMVALLWGRGDNAATVRLEHLWHTLVREKHFSLFCAYPKSGFTQGSAASIHEICATHTRMYLE
ncbi:MAG TPA: MEDS domain-containing protein [Gemmatimonadaceae bacterium]|nr:MEDS domain-containing protein [Gemmatimonadaceae bacterium]